MALGGSPPGSRPVLITGSRGGSEGAFGRHGVMEVTDDACATRGIAGIRSRAGGPASDAHPKPGGLPAWHSREATFRGSKILPVVSATLLFDGREHPPFPAVRHALFCAWRTQCHIELLPGCPGARPAQTNRHLPRGLTVSAIPAGQLHLPGAARRAAVSSGPGRWSSRRVTPSKSPAIAERPSGHGRDGTLMAGWVRVRPRASSPREMTGERQAPRRKDDTA